MYQKLILCKPSVLLNYACVAGLGQYASTLSYPLQRLTFPSAWYAYDYFLTLPLEISAIWRTKWSGTSVLFVVNRYLFMFTWTFFCLESLLITQSSTVSTLPYYCAVTHEEIRRKFNWKLRLIE